jgi:DNA-binding protein HU-beta
MTNYKGEKMKKSDIISKLAESSKITKSAASKVVDDFIEIITRALKNGETITLPGFGTWATTQRAARTGRNPQTGQTIQIKAAKVVRFKVGKNLKDAVSGNK